MIVSASRRTDIPAFYVNWLINRIHNREVMVRNPMNVHQVSRISLDPRIVDCFVFWTKNPKKLLPRLNELSDYNYYFQFTLTPYNRSLEPKLLEKRGILKTFQILSDTIGAGKVIWRYDPIIFTPEYDFRFHQKSFKAMASALHGYTKRCVISFVDMYKKTQRNLFGIPLVTVSNREMKDIARVFADTGNKYSIEVVSCAEEIDLSKSGVKHGKCIDDKLIAELSGKELYIGKDKTQRGECGCTASIDIGAYNTCSHGCLYCYANFNFERVNRNWITHNPKSPLICGALMPDDKVHDRKIVSCFLLQQKLLHLESDLS